MSDEGLVFAMKAHEYAAMFDAEQHHGWCQNLRNEVAQRGQAATKKMSAHGMELSHGIFHLALDFARRRAIYSLLQGDVKKIPFHISEKYLSFAKRRNPQYSFVIATGQNLCLRSKTFPQILINGVIHHLNDQQAKYMRNETRRILTDNGKLLLN